MERDTLSRLIEENMKTILGFSLSRLSDRLEAEDLAGDIVCEILKSAHRLNDAGRFYAYMWRIAENTYSNYLRARKRRTAGELDEEIASTELSVEDGLILREDFCLLRRELSLLSEQYRRATVLYYMENLPCGEIADKLGISAEMVKYYLFRARKILREGMNMDRILGEKSYNPKPFEIDFWGTRAGEDKEYRAFQERKLRGNILLTAYYTPVTIQELSVELGVAVTYLEDELKLLIKREYLTEKNGKYQTNIPIFTEECNEVIGKRLSGCADEAVEGLMTVLGAETQKYKETVGNAMSDENSFRWQVFTLCSHFGLAEISSYVDSTYGDYPDGGPYRHVNGGGGKGFVWGRSAGNMKHKYNGIYDGLPDKKHRGSVVAFNFAQLANAQQFESRILEEVVAGVTEKPDNLEKRILRLLEDERYFKYGRPVFPVYTGEQFDAFPIVLSSGIKFVADNCRKACEFAAKIVADHAPAHIRGEAEHIGAIVYQHDGLYYLVDALMKKGWLRPVNDTEKPAMFVVTK